MKIELEDEEVELSDEQIEMFNNLTKLQQKISLYSLRGYSNMEAYRRAGGSAKKDQTMGASSTEILKKPKVKQFINSFSKNRIKAAIMSKEEMMERLTSFGRSSIFDVAEIEDHTEMESDDDDGLVFFGSKLRVKNKDKIPDSLRGFIKSVKKSKNGLEVTLHDTLSAMKQLADLGGYNAASKTEVSTKIEVTNDQRKLLDKVLDDEY
jgi:phage terminase small subunit